MSGAPLFPPLLTGEEVPGGQDPFSKAVAQAAIGCESGLICWHCAEDRLDAAVVFAPEEPLADAMTVVFAVTLGLGDALGALAPPEVAVHYVWPGSLRVNGAACGEIRAASDTKDAEQVPNWLVVGIGIPFSSPSDDPGLHPDRTFLNNEGCGEIAPVRLLESWSRHMLTWVNRREEDGLAPLHAEWRSRAWGLGEALPEGGLFMGLDERGGMLMKTQDRTELRPLTEMLE